MTIYLPERLRLQNPILTKDLLCRMRGSKAFVVQGIYIGILAVMMGIAYLSWWISHKTGASPMMISSQLGRMLYQLIFQTQAAMIALITPALTAGTITLEHEQQTYELLACTRLSPRTIVVGKLLSGWLFVVMLLTCSLPMAALCLMFGGVSLGEICWSYLMLCLFALFFGSLGIFYSAHFRRSMVAIMVSFVSIFGFLFLTLMIDPQFNGIGHILNPFAFIADSTQPVQFYQMSLPGWLPGLILLPALSLFLLNWAIDTLPNFVVSRAFAIRGLLALLMLVVLALMLSNSSSSLLSFFNMMGGGTTNPAQTMTALLIPASFVLLALPFFFATGALPFNRPRSLLIWFLSGINPKAIFSKELRGGWWYLLLLTTLFCGLLSLVGWLQHGSTIGAAVPVSTHVWRFFWIMATVLFCYSALGMLGAALSERKVGINLMIIFFLVTHLLPGILWVYYTAGGAVTSGPLYYLMYLAPYIGFSVVVNPAVVNSLPANLQHSVLHLWEIIPIIYSVIGIVILIIAELVNCKRMPEAQPVVGQQSLQPEG